MTGASAATRSAELANYARRCADARLLGPALITFAERARAALALRLMPGVVEAAQPDAVRRAREALAAGEQLEPRVAAFGGPDWLPERVLTITGGTLSLRTRGDWHTAFADPEVAASLHRWNWLLYGITTDAKPLTRDDGLALMRSWVSECLDDPHHAGVAYTTSERIVNGLLFLSLEADHAVPADLALAFRTMARQVASELEYRPEGQTGNHAFNNARALLFAGVLADLDGARDLAYAIAAERLPVLVTSDGFMREGSSHYHLLFTRWVLEMLWVARRARDSAFVTLLARYATRLVERSWFFVVCAQDGTCRMPLIGDVSPDFPPDWLTGLPWSSLARESFVPEVIPPAPARLGWSSLFIGELPSSQPPRLRSNGVVCCPEGGWCRAEVGVWTLFVRARRHDGVLRSGHEHPDLGSYVLYRNGEALLVDCGRHDYGDAPLGMFGQGARAHNAPIINGLGAMARGPSWLSHRYTAVDVELSAALTPAGCIVTVVHSGFERLAGIPIHHRRELRLEAAGLTVTDHLGGTGSCDVELPLHFGPNVSGAETGRDWQLPSARGRIVIDPSLATKTVVGTPDRPEGGLYFPEYGRYERICTLRATGRITLPVALSHSLHDELA